MPDQDRIDLSIIVRVVGGGIFLHRCLDSLAPQVEGSPIEVIAPYDSTAKGVELLKRKFPWVAFLDTGVVRTVAQPGTGEAAHETYDRNTSAGLQVARGEILGILEDFGVPDPDWCRRMLEAHRLLPYGAIGGSVEHGGRGALNWAVYLLDFGRYQLPMREGPARYLTDVNISYKRAALLSVKELWSERYNEITVNHALAENGVVLWRKPEIVVREDHGDLSFRSTLVERLWWGKVFGYARTQQMSLMSRLIYILLSPAIPAVRLARLGGKTMGGGRNRSQFLLCLPQLLLLTLSWSLGELMGYLAAGTSQPLAAGGDYQE